MKSHGRRAAFTLVELLVATCISAGLGLIIYGVAEEGLFAFARNISINRSYSNARQTLDKIAIEMQSAGAVPILVDATGADIIAGSTTYAAGIRFWRYNATPSYYVTTPALTSTTLTISLAMPGTTSTYISAPAVGDMITIAAIGFQAQVTAVSASATSATLTFSGTVASNTSPTLTSSALATATTAAAATGGGKMVCLDWTSLAFIAINNQLRYYPTFISGTTNVNTASNYQILTYLISSLGSANTTMPFSLGPSPTINVDIYAQAPDYSNRAATVAGSTTGTNNSYAGVSIANSYIYYQTALASRNATILRTPF